MRRLLLLSLATSLAMVATAIPASLVDEIKANEVSATKVKRAHAESNSVEENVREPAPFYNQPVAIKRGANLNPDPQWDQQQRSFPEMQPSDLYDDRFDQEKSIAEYEKGFRYGTGKDKLDEALENAVLKAELYGEPASINRYRYYGGADERRRKRRDTKKMRYKDDLDLLPEDILAILTLYENERQQQQHPSYTPWEQRDDLSSSSDDDDTWLDTPVYPHASNRRYGSYFYEDKPFDDRRKRKRSGDPTRELRYLNGPNENDFYTLSRLLNSQRGDPGVPVYHRYVL